MALPRPGSVRGLTAAPPPPPPPPHLTAAGAMASAAPQRRLWPDGAAALVERAAVAAARRDRRPGQTPRPVESPGEPRELDGNPPRRAEFQRERSHVLN